MNKKQYIAPATEMIALSTEPIMGELSGNGPAFSNDSQDFDQNNRSRQNGGLWAEDEEE